MDELPGPERNFPGGGIPHRIELDAAFDAAMAPWRRPGGPVSVLFSGGVDSGLLAWELRERPATSLVTVGRPGSADLSGAERSARALGVPWTADLLSDEGLATTLAKVRAATGPLPRARQSIFVALAAAIERAPGTDVLCGQGADELFLGYAHFAGLSAEAAAARSAADLDRLRREDWPRSVRLADFLGHRLHAPYLDPDFVRVVGAIPIHERMPAPVPKALLRRWAKARGLPSEVADRPKRALQFGSGIDAWLRRKEPA